MAGSVGDAASVRGDGSVEAGLGTLRDLWIGVKWAGGGPWSSEVVDGRLRDVFDCDTDGLAGGLEGVLEPLLTGSTAALGDTIVEDIEERRSRIAVAD